MVVALLMLAAVPAFAECSDAPQSGVEWRGCTHYGRDFAGADLSNSDLTRSRFTRTDFTGADLSEADLRVPS